jgi:hypothetical protein
LGRLDRVGAGVAGAGGAGGDREGACVTPYTPCSWRGAAHASRRAFSATTRRSGDMAGELEA